MSSVIISGDTSGSITLAAPAVAGTNTITLPASTGTMLTTGSPQSGGVIQVVNATYATQTSNSTTTYADTGLTASITPKFATSTILVLVNHTQSQKSAGNSDNGLTLNLCRNGSNIIDFTDSLGYTNSALLNVFNCSFIYKDSPATTSATTYKTQFKNNFGASAVLVQHANKQSSITLMEIAA
jgi:hypothetical protein